MGAFAVHDPDAVLDYSFDWSSWLADEQSIDASEWSAPDGISIVSEVSGSTTVVRVSVTDPTLLGTKVRLVNHVTSTDGQEDDRTLTLYIAQQ